MIKEMIIDTNTGKSLGDLNDIFGRPTLETVDYYQTNVRFKSTTLTDAGSATIASPTEGGALILTDIIISTDKVLNSRLSVFFADAIEKISIFDGHPIDAPINTALGLHGAFTGWKNASLRMLAVGIKLQSTVAVGYIKIPKGLEYAVWYKMRE